MGRATPGGSGTSGTGGDGAGPTRTLPTSGIDLMFNGGIDKSMIREHALEIEVSRNTRGLLVKVVGALDMANAPDFLSTFEPPPNKPMTLDLRGLSFLDSSGLSSLIRLREGCGGRLRLIEGPRSVQQIFEITGTESEFDWMDPSREPRR
jgi:anti-anti-sigma factor